MIQTCLIFVFIAGIQSGPINPGSLDWRTKGAILPVPGNAKCVAHSGVVNILDSISAMYKLQGEKLIKLSQQQIYDCNPTFGPQDWCPCGKAGNASLTLNMIGWENLNRDINSEESYPYTGQCTKQCHFNKTGTSLSLGSFMYSNDNVTNEEAELYQGIKAGPLVVNVNSASSAFKNYQGGILDNPNCTEGHVDHSLLLVGYGTENGVDYWIARNSWGTNWGENGYIRIVRDKNMCGFGDGLAQPFSL